MPDWPCISHFFCSSFRSCSAGLPTWCCERAHPLLHSVASNLIRPSGLAHDANPGGYSTRQYAPLQNAALQNVPLQVLRTTQGPSWGYLKVNVSETLSIFGDKRPRNGSKNGEMAPRTGTGYPHIGPFVVHSPSLVSPENPRPFFFCAGVWPSHLAAPIPQGEMTAAKYGAWVFSGWDQHD